MKPFLIMFFALATPLMAEDNAQRDEFVRHIVGVLIRQKASHICVNQHVVTAVNAWNHYQEIAK